MSTSAVLDVVWSCGQVPPGWRVAEARHSNPPSWNGGAALSVAMGVTRPPGATRGLYVAMVPFRWHLVLESLEEDLTRVHGFSAPSDLAHRLLGHLLAAVPPDHAAVVASAGARASAALLRHLGRLPDSLLGLLRVRSP